MARTNIDEELVERAMRIYRLSSKREAVDLALHDAWWAIRRAARKLSRWRAWHGERPRRYPPQRHP